MKLKLSVFPGLLAACRRVTWRLHETDDTSEIFKLTKLAGSEVFEFLPERSWRTLLWCWWPRGAHSWWLQWPGPLRPEPGLCTAEHRIPLSCCVVADCHPSVSYDWATSKSWSSPGQIKGEWKLCPLLVQNINSCIEGKLQYFQAVVMCWLFSLLKSSL